MGRRSSASRTPVPAFRESERGKVLERFYRVPGTSGEGSGLGLAIVQEVVARHRGVLDIDVPSGHTGTRFCVRFPGAERSTAPPI